MGMEFTGERFVPGCSQQLAYEHYHRYFFASRLAEGKDVIDLACGEGYGSFMLSRRARSVLGLDIDVATIGYAAAKYAKDNLEYRVGDCTSLGEKVTDGSADVVVMFEAVEHLDSQGQDASLLEVRRVLRPGGLLVVSSPNKPLYRKISCPDNEYHQNELTLGEFTGFLKKHFANVDLYGQRVECASMLWPLVAGGNVFSGKWDYLDMDAPVFDDTLPPPDDALYFVAVCSDGDAGNCAQGGVLVERGMDVMLGKDRRLEAMGKLEADVIRLSKDIEDIYQSHSWKLTAPLRKVMAMLKRKGG